MTGAGKRSRKARAAANSESRARCVKSPDAITKSGRAAAKDRAKPSTRVESIRPKCRSEI